MQKDDSQIPLISYKTYAVVWLALLVLLGATITIARGHLLVRYSVLAPLAIASAKAGLVLTYFMHLKYEGRFLKTMLLVAVSTLTAFIALTFMDVWYR
ncbi:MAG: cytochrome C oxidase subunit IV family protein [Deltaproteobacteria bacterium]|jgi:cytochrome c oxidase subunit 4